MRYRLDCDLALIAEASQADFRGTIALENAKPVLWDEKRSTKMRREIEASSVPSEEVWVLVRVGMATAKILQNRHSSALSGLSANPGATRDAPLIHRAFVGFEIVASLLRCTR